MFYSQERKPAVKESASKVDVKKDTATKENEKPKESGMKKFFNGLFDSHRQRAECSLRVFN